MGRCCLPKRLKHCLDTKEEDLLQRLAAAKYISLYLPCCLKTAGQGVYFVVVVMGNTLRGKCKTLTEFQKGKIEENIYALKFPALHRSHVIANNSFTWMFWDKGSLPLIAEPNNIVLLFICLQI